MGDKPIQFKTPQMRALLNGVKTQDRWVLKEQPPIGAEFFAWDIGSAGVFAWFVRDGFCGADMPVAKLPAWRGDRLWVRESYRFDQEWDDCRPSDFDKADAINYEADDYSDVSNWGHPFVLGKLRPSAQMPRWASRLTLVVTDVRVQRLQDISEADAVAEGAMWHNGGDTGHSGWRHDLSDVHKNARSSFARLWSSLYGPEAWGANPWVTAITFDMVRANIDRVA